MNVVLQGRAAAARGAAKELANAIKRKAEEAEKDEGGGDAALRLLETKGSIEKDGGDVGGDGSGAGRNVGKDEDEAGAGVASSLPTDEPPMLRLCPSASGGELAGTCVPDCASCAGFSTPKEGHAPECEADPPPPPPPRPSTCVPAPQTCATVARPTEETCREEDHCEFVASDGLDAASCVPADQKCGEVKHPSKDRCRAEDHCQYLPGTNPCHSTCATCAGGEGTDCTACVEAGLDPIDPDGVGHGECPLPYTGRVTFDFSSTGARAALKDYLEQIPGMNAETIVFGASKEGDDGTSASFELNVRPSPGNDAPDAAETRHALEGFVRQAEPPEGQDERPTVKVSEVLPPAYLPSWIQEKQIKEEVKAEMKAEGEGKKTGLESRE
jgi:hypothetical protein